MFIVKTSGKWSEDGILTWTAHKTFAGAKISCQRWMQWTKEAYHQEAQSPDWHVPCSLIFRPMMGGHNNDQIIGYETDGEVEILCGEGMDQCRVFVVEVMDGEN